MPLFKRVGLGKSKRNSERRSLITDTLSHQSKEQTPISENLEQNITVLHEIYSNFPDAKFRQFLIGPYKALLFLIDGLSDMS